MDEPLTAGQKLRAELEAEADEQGIDFDRREQLLIAEACATADLIASLENVIDEEGVTAERRGGKVVHQAVREVRLQRQTLQRLLASLDFVGEPPAKSASEQNRRNANSRWASHGRPQR